MLAAGNAAADRSVPRFAVRPLPDAYRAPKQRPIQYDDYYALGPATVVARRNCLVATVYRAPPQYSGFHRASVLGWLAIGIPDGKTTFLTLENYEPQDGFQVVPGFGVHRWSRDTCALELRFLPKDAPRDSPDAVVGERTDLWEWDPATPAPKRLGPFVPVAGLSSALVGSDYRVEWSDADADPWNGRVRLARRDSGESKPFSLRHLVRPTAEARQVMWTEQFGPTEQRNSIVVVGRCTRFGGGESVGFSVSRVDLDSGRATWELDQPALEKAIDRRVVRGLYLVDGPIRPCPRLPLLVLDRDCDDAPEILWWLDVKAGRLAGTYPLAWKGSLYPRGSFRPRVCATPSGQLVAYNSMIPGAQRPLMIFDLAREDFVARLPTGNCDPIGFIADERLVLAGVDEVRSLAAPYTGDGQVVFRLEREVKPGARSRGSEERGQEGRRSSGEGPARRSDSGGGTP